MLIKQIFNRLSLLPVILALPAAEAFAHHSFAAFDMTKLETVSGKVVEVQYKNPHAWLFVDVKDGENTVTYAIEMGGPNILMRQGWMVDTVKVGDLVSVQMNPMRDSTKKGGSIVGLKQASGKVFGTWK